MSSYSDSVSAWKELFGTAYKPEELTKIEWVFGAVASEDYKKMQEFVVLYGPQMSGKTTVLNIAAKLFGDSILIQEDLDLRKVRDDSLFLITTAITQAAISRYNTDSGIVRRMLVVNTSGSFVPLETYRILLDRIYSDLEEVMLHCVKTYNEMSGFKSELAKY